MSDEYQPQFIPFVPKVSPEDKKKKGKPEKEEKKGPEKKKEKPEKEEKKGPEKKKEQLKIIPEDIKTYTWQMEKFQIMLADSPNILVALMLDSAPSEPIKEGLLKFTSSFIQKFKTEVETFRGNVSWFRPAAEIADDSFNMFLMRPQCLPMTEDALKEIILTDTEAKLVKLAQEISKDTGYFFLANLLDEVLKRLKYPREKVLRSFFNLHRKGAFLPISIEEVGNEVQKRKLWQQITCVEAISQEECDILMDDLMLATEESRFNLLAKILQFKKKTRAIQIREELAKRRRVRKERDEYFKKVDEYLRANDFTEIVNMFDRIIQLSMELGEDSVAQELTKRAQVYRDELSQMTQRIPVLRSQRNEALNQAEMLELGGRYVEAAQQFDIASKLSVEIGEMDKARDYLNQTQRLMNLSELAKLREKLR